MLIKRMIFDLDGMYSDLEEVLEIADGLDEYDIGCYKFTEGKHTTRDIIRIELARFLAYLVKVGGMYKEKERAMINSIVGDYFSDQELREFCSTVDKPKASRTMSLHAFLNLDEVGNSQSARKCFIKIFDSFGEFVCYINGNSNSKAEKDKYINDIESYNP